MYFYLTAIGLIYITYNLFQKMISKPAICKCNAKMDGKVVIVTGSNTGIGFETAKDLAKRGAKVILACRSEKKGIAARDAIINETGNSNVIFKSLDLSSLKSVRDFANDFISTEPKLHVLINNAGTGGNEYNLTSDNLLFESQVNHFGPFLLTTLLLPRLKESAPSRIVNLSSVMHKFGKFDVERFHKIPNSFFEKVRVYSNTKLATNLFTVKLAKYLEGSGVTANSLHPGAVMTEMFRYDPAIVRFIISLYFLTPYQGAQTTIHVAVSPELENVTGKYFVECKETNPSSRSQDLALADKLWQLSERVCNS